MKISLHKLEIVDYNRITFSTIDTANPVDLIYECISSANDALFNAIYSSNDDDLVLDYTRMTLELLECQTRSILIKYNINLDEKVFQSREESVRIPDTITECMGRILVFFGLALQSACNLGNEEYNQQNVLDFVKGFCTEAYIIITGVLQYHICQQRE